LRAIPPWLEWHLSKKVLLEIHKMPAKGKQPIKRKGLEDAVQELRNRASKIQVLAAAMERRGLAEISVMNQPMLERAMKSIDRFILSCRSEIGEA
jgi:hypothetical protein